VAPSPFPSRTAAVARSAASRSKVSYGVVLVREVAPERRYGSVGRGDTAMNAAPPVGPVDTVSHVPPGCVNWDCPAHQAIEARCNSPPDTDAASRMSSVARASRAIEKMAQCTGPDAA
jgi:hypothetical protein